MTDTKPPAKRGLQRHGALSPAQRRKRFLAKVLASGGRMMHFALDGETAKLLAHIRRRDGLKNDTEAAREAIHCCAKARRRNKAATDEA